ncbi:MAG: ATP synthase subunit I [Mycobacteriaceae bacterium]
MTTPSPDAPLVFPSVAFRPGLLLSICAALSAVAIAIATWSGNVLVGVFFGIGLLLGLVNALLVHRSVSSITADANPIKRKMALNSATRLLVITAIGLTIAFVFRPPGLGVVFGLAVFQIVLVLCTALPVWKKIRTGDPDGAPIDETGPSIPASLADEMLKD